MFIYFYISLQRKCFKCHLGNIVFSNIFIFFLQVYRFHIPSCWSSVYPFNKSLVLNDIIL